MVTDIIDDENNIAEREWKKWIHQQKKGKGHNISYSCMIGNVYVCVCEYYLP